MKAFIVFNEKGDELKALHYSSNHLLNIEIYDINCMSSVHNYEFELSKEEASQLVEILQDFINLDEE